MGYDILKPGEDLPKSKYSGVWAFLSKGKYIQWQATKTHKGKRYKKIFKTEREAAIAYDKMCLPFGLEPVNILKRKDGKD